MYIMYLLRTDMAIYIIWYILYIYNIEVYFSYKQCVYYERDDSQEYREK